MPGCSRRAVISASRTKRTSLTWLRAISSLMAMSRQRSTSWARDTRPRPPRPCSPRMWYRSGSRVCCRPGAAPGAGAGDGEPGIAAESLVRVSCDAASGVSLPSMLAKLRTILEPRETPKAMVALVVPHDPRAAHLPPRLTTKARSDVEQAPGRNAVRPTVRPHTVGTGTRAEDRSGKRSAVYRSDISHRNCDADTEQGQLFRLFRPAR